MHKDQIFWCVQFGIGAFVLIALMVTLSGYSANHKSQIVELVKQGSSPIAASCALDDSRGNNPSCIIIVTNGE